MVVFDFRCKVDGVTVTVMFVPWFGIIPFWAPEQSALETDGQEQTGICASVRLALEYLP